MESSADPITGTSPETILMEEFQPTILMEEFFPHDVNRTKQRSQTTALYSLLEQDQFSTDS